MDAVDSAVAGLYAAISFPRGAGPDLAGIRACFLPGARLVHARADGLDAMDVDTFVTRLDGQVRAGALLAVEEREAASRTEIFQGIASRFSTFEARFEGPGGALAVRGVNAISLVREQDRWLVVSIVWQDEA